MHQVQTIRKLLFITWDGPQTRYMEGLFMPIFKRITNLSNWEFHVIQFTWAPEKQTSETSAVAKKLGIHYNAYAVRRRPHPLVGSAITVFKGKAVIENYIKRHQIDIVMPRSTFPAMMINMIKKRNLRLIFDADGLPLEERIEFNGLSINSKQYQFLKKQETKMLIAAQHVITRSQKAIDIHVEKIGEQFRSKFAVVFNGRDEVAFTPDADARLKRRYELRILSSEKVFLYCGSLGNQYGWNEMLEIFDVYASSKPAKWVIITGDVQFAEAGIPTHLKDKIIVFTSTVADVPNYLNIADVAFALRQPSFSMQGVAPIKLGEYLLMGLPTIASKDIGDTEDILNNIQGCFMYDFKIGKKQIKALMEWLNKLDAIDREQIRKQALPYFSINAAANSYINVLNKLIF